MTQAFQHVHKLSDIAQRRPTFLAIGVFDGVHRGHQALLRQMIAAARGAGACPAVLTFFPHPKEVLSGVRGRLYLASLAERVERLAELGIELIITHSFDEEVRKMRAAAFVDHLCQALDLRQLWGGNFSLGYQREGNAVFLRELGRDKGFTVHELQELVWWRGKPVSSSRIRRALAAGAMEEVNGGLGRPFALGGEVLRGDQRGRTIGFPTANLAIWDQALLPAKGVYATYAWLGEKRLPAAANVGVRPTVNGSTLSVEAHLLDFEGDIYGNWLRLEFLQRIRDEHKFPSLEALTTQIAADVDMVRRLLVADA